MIRCSPRPGTVGICDAHGQDLADCSNRARNALRRWMKNATTHDGNRLRKRTKRLLGRRG